MRRNFSAAAFRSLRRESGLTQEELADRVGATSQTLSNVENGRVVPRLELAAAVASELGVPLSAFFGPVQSLQAARSRLMAEEVLQEVPDHRIGDIVEWLKRATTTA